MENNKFIWFVILIQVLFINIALGQHKEISIANCVDGNKVEVNLEKYFQNDSVSVYVDNKLVFSEVITTDQSVGLAKSFNFQRPKGKSFLLRIEVNGCKKQKEIPRKDKYIFVTYYQRECEILLELSDKDRDYF